MIVLDIACLVKCTDKEKCEKDYSDRVFKIIVFLIVLTKKNTIKVTQIEFKDIACFVNFTDIGKYDKD